MSPSVGGFGQRNSVIASAGILVREVRVGVLLKDLATPPDKGLDLRDLPSPMLLVVSTNIELVLDVVCDRIAIAVDVSQGVGS